MREPLPSWSRLPRFERGGILVFTFLSALNFALPFCISHMVKRAPLPDFSKFQHRLEARFEAISEEKTTAPPPVAMRRTASAPQPEIELFPFDPNHASKETLMRLGLSGKVSQTLVNYRKKGGRFYKKEDLRRVYGLRAEDYERLEPYIALENVKPKRTNTPPAVAHETEIKPESPTLPPQRAMTVALETAEPVEIDVNVATAEEWQRLRGIGPYFAERIVRFREALGGFASIEQIAETYNLPDTVFQSIRPHLVLSPVRQTIDINFASPQQLKDHPYITYKQANVLANYRRFHGPFRSPDDLKKVGGPLRPEDVDRLVPYLNFREK
ncbi:MAG: helix-hairpin-helix domain-containing protein [Bacteroidetes bacterium]|nr:MAG: helix-hairpin-helix domain-containing protein [Bacteroidota bacterium]